MQAQNAQNVNTPCNSASTTNAASCLHCRHGPARLYYPSRTRRGLHHVYVAVSAFPTDDD